MKQNWSPLFIAGSGDGVTWELVTQSPSFLYLSFCIIRCVKGRRVCGPVRMGLGPPAPRRGQPARSRVGVLGAVVDTGQIVSKALKVVIAFESSILLTRE